MKHPLDIFRSIFLVLPLTFAAAPLAFGQMYINEVYLDPPGSSGDLVYEYVELRGEPNASLEDTYFIVLENETGTPTANPGQIEAVFDLGSLSNPFLGSNGFLTLTQAGASYSGLNPESNNLQSNLVSYTWGSGPASSVGFTDEGSNGVMENSGGTFILLKNNGGSATAPTIASPDLIDLDADDDNEIDSGTIYDSWTILDSIGISGDPGELNGFMYAPINFSLATPPGGGNVSAGATFVDVGFEIEYFGRWGNSTGSTAADWHIANLTNDNLAGFDGPTDFRQSGDPHGVDTSNQFVESSQGVPYGTHLTNTLGSENLVIQDGDSDPVYDGEQYVFDGDVDGLDFLAWQRNYGFGLNLSEEPAYATRQHGDSNHDRVVDEADLALWQANYGVGSSPLASVSLAVPEPATLPLLFASAMFCWWRPRA